MKVQHTWKKAKSLQSVFNECMDIDDVDEDIRQEFRQISLFDQKKEEKDWKQKRQQPQKGN